MNQLEPRDIHIYSMTQFSKPQFVAQVAASWLSEYIKVLQGRMSGAEAHSSQGDLPITVKLCRSIIKSALVTACFLTYQVLVIRGNE